MTRETKVGIVVAASFVSLVGGVFFIKYVQDKPSATTVQDKNAPATTTSAPPANNKPAQPATPKPSQTQANNNGGLPALPGSLNEPFPPLPDLPPVPSGTVPPPAPVPSQFTLPGDDEQQVVRSSSSTNNGNSQLRPLPNQLPQMQPLPTVVPARADEPAIEIKPMPMSPPPIDLPPTEAPKPMSNEVKPMGPPMIELPGSEKKDLPKLPNQDRNDSSNLTIVPPPSPIKVEPMPMPKIEPKNDGMELTPLPGAPTVKPINSPPPSIDIKPMDVPKPIDIPKPMDLAKPVDLPKPEVPLPNANPNIPPPPDAPKGPEPTLPTPKPMDTAPSITPVPTQIEPAPKITPSPNNLNDLPPLPPMPLPKNPAPAMTSIPVNNLPPGSNQSNQGALQPPNIDRNTQVNAVQPSNPVQTPRVSQPQIDSYDEEWYTAQAGDSFAALSQKFYSDSRYAQALQQYNFDRTGLDAIRAGSTVRVPPVRVLERKHPAAIPGYQPPAPAVATAPKQPNRSAAMGLPQSVGDPGNLPSPSPDMGSEYTVKSSPKTLRDIAKETMGSSDKWNLIFRLNRWVNPDEALPVNTKIRMPSDAVFTP
ncbi:MAG TPA: hypothetical protein VKS79_23725 [Gemmataceae bacterium]|nr:hypothetical protein [Gemmataceae bacterium]